MNFTKSHILIITFAILFFVGNDIFIGYLSESSPETLSSLKENVSSSIDSVSDSVFAKTDSYPKAGETPPAEATTQAEPTKNSSSLDEETASDGTFFELKEIVILLPD